MNRTLIILGKELRELLREPHVLGLSLGFPLIFYPLLVWGALQFQLLQEGLAERSPPRVEIALKGALPAEDLDALQAEPIEAGTGGPEAVAEGDLDAYLSLDVQGYGATAHLVHRSTEARSKRAHALLLERLDTLRDAQRGRLATAHGVEPEALTPFVVEEENLTPPKEMGSFILSRALPGMVVIVMLIAGLYPAVEVMVGERERQTLETTLSSAAGRSAIVMGKVLAILTMIFIAVLGNLGAMGLTLMHVLSLKPGTSEIGLSIALGDVALVLPIILAAGVMVAAMMVLSVLPARSFKEGQNLASFTMTASMMLVVVAMLPGVELTLATALVPLTNIALVIRDGLNGELSSGIAALVLFETLAIAGGLMALALSIIQKESYLFAGALPPWLKWLERFNDRG